MLRALHWLMKASDLYKHANVEIDQQWIKRITEESNAILHSFFESQIKACSETNNVDLDGVLDETLQDIPRDQNHTRLNSVKLLQTILSIKKCTSPFCRKLFHVCF